MLRNLNLLFILTLFISTFTFSSCGVKKAKATSDLDGTWRLVIPTPRGERNPIVKIEGQKVWYNDELVGQPVTFKDNTVTFPASEIAGKIGKMDFMYECTLDEEDRNKMTGVYSIASGSLTGRSGSFTAERVQE